MEKIVGAEWLRRAVAGDRGAIEALQAEAYAEIGVRTGVTPIPLKWDYAAVLRDWDVFLAEDADGLAGVLILHVRQADLFLESISVATHARGTGLGGRLLAATETAAATAGRAVVRLLTNEKNVDLIALYRRTGYTVETIEDMGDRRAVHMVKHLTQS
jgi:ribosomal protein S18 acetylase RimI-like enzyme